MREDHHEGESGILARRFSMTVHEGRRGALVER